MWIGAPSASCFKESGVPILAMLARVFLVSVHKILMHEPQLVVNQLQAQRHQYPPRTVAKLSVILTLLWSVLTQDQTEIHSMVWGSFCICCPPMNRNTISTGECVPLKIHKHMQLTWFRFELFLHRLCEADFVKELTHPRTVGWLQSFCLPTCLAELCALRAFLEYLAFSIDVAGVLWLCVHM